MKTSNECVAVTFQVSKKLKARAEKIRGRNCTLAELLRRALAAYVEKREKAKEMEPWGYEGRGFEGALHSRAGGSF